MPSNRKQKAKEKRSEQPDVMSDLENTDVIPGKNFRNEAEYHQNEKEIEVNLESNELQHNVKTMREDFKFLLNTKSRENSEITVETAGMVNCEITSQVTRNFDEIKIDLKTQISETIISAIMKEVLPFIQNLFGKTGSNAKVDL